MSLVLGYSAFSRMFTWEVQRAVRYQDFLALCLVRIESPEDASPDLCKTVGERIVDLLRAADVVGLTATNIFVLLLHTPEVEAAAIADRIRNRIEGSPFPMSSAEVFRVRVNVAVAVFPSDGTTEESLLNGAEARLGAIAARRDMSA